MKAKEYAAKVTCQNTRQDAIIKVAEIGVDFVKEFIALKNQRKIMSDAATVNLIKEFDNKFRVFAVIVNTYHFRFKNLVAPYGFIELIKVQWPFIYDIYKRTK